MRRNFKVPTCAVCGIDIYSSGNYGYMLHTKVWRQAIQRGRRHRITGDLSTHDLLCVPCLELCLGRKLERADFNWTLPINTHPEFDRNVRLQRRMKAGG